MSVPTLRQAVKALSIAPLGAVLVVAFAALFRDDDQDFGFQLTTLALLAYSLVVFYIAELLLVLPGIALRPAFRDPHPIVAGLYGIFVGWSLPLLRLVVEGHGRESLFLATIAGGASGVVYNLIIRRQRTGGAGDPRVPSDIGATA